MVEGGVVVMYEEKEVVDVSILEAGEARVSVVFRSGDRLLVQLGMQWKGGIAC